MKTLEETRRWLEEGMPTEPSEPVEPVEPVVVVSVDTSTPMAEEMRASIEKELRRAFTRDMSIIEVLPGARVSFDVVKRVDEVPPSTVEIKPIGLTGGMTLTRDEVEMAKTHTDRLIEAFRLPPHMIEPAK